ncbi:MAG: hypothetical protein ACTSRW_13645 [Candidatus Helarchaeota archaeon]
MVNSLHSAAISLLKRFSVKFNLSQIILFNENKEILFIDKPIPIDEEQLQALIQEIYPTIEKHFLTEEEFRGILISSSRINKYLVRSSIQDKNILLLVELEDLTPLTRSGFHDELLFILQRIIEMIEAKPTPQLQITSNLEKTIQRLEGITSNMQPPKFPQIKRLMEYLR